MSDILGIGVDIESIDRFRNLPRGKNKRFYERIFTSFELEYCFKKKDPYPHLTARFAAKEAVIKAFSGLKKLYYSQIEIRNYNDGKPYLKIVSKDKKLNKKEPVNEKLFISISHSDTHALAFVLVCR